VYALIVVERLHTECDAAQWLTKRGDLWATLDSAELLWLAMLGAVMEGALNPWWLSLLDKRTAQLGRSVPHVGILRFFLDTLVWTPLCCVLVFSVEHTFFDDHYHLVHSHSTESVANAGQAAQEYPQTAHGVDAAGTAAPVDTWDQETVQTGPEQALAEDVSSSRTFQLVATWVSRMVPMPLRPLLKDLASAGSWTLLDQIEP
jgi:hypothetical protein